MTSSQDYEKFALVVHEVRSPVAALVAIVGALGAESSDAASLRKLVELSLAACQSIARILGDAPLGSLQLGQVDITSIVEEAVVGARLGGARVRADLDVDLPEIEGDRIRLRQALDNLIGNAVRATGAGGEIVVGAHSNEHMVIVSVSDSGGGIPAEEHERIFEPGVRLDSGPEGSGLGLAIVRAVAEAHGGSVAVQSSPGHGATFSIVLPIGGDQPAGTASSS